MRKLEDLASGIFEVSHGGGTQNRPMEGLRGIAVALVFLVHYHSLFSPFLGEGSLTTSAGAILGRVGHSGVDLFFLMSGYLIYGTIAKKRDFRYQEYLFRRFQRIYPTFFAVFLIYFALSFIFPSEAKFPTTGLGSTVIWTLENLLLLPGLFDITPLITVAWSLSYEIFFYLLIPLILVGFGLRKANSRIRIWFWVVVSIICFSFYFLLSENGGFAVPVRMTMFVSGILLFELESKVKTRWKHLGDISLVLALVLLALPATYPPMTQFIPLVPFLLFFFVAFSAFHSQGLIGRLTVWTPLRYLGNSSYSFYLIHGLVLKFLFLVVSSIDLVYTMSEGLFFLLLAPYFTIAFCASTLLFMLVERPLSLTRKDNKTGVQG